MAIQEPTITIKARVRAGKLEPLEPLDLEEGREVTITVSAAETAAPGADPLAAPARGWAGNVPDDFEERVAADRRMAFPQEAPTW